MSEKAKAMIGALTGAASFVQSCKGGDAAIKDAVREWAVSKSELSQYVESLESRLAAAEAALAACKERKARTHLAHCPAHPFIAMCICDQEHTP